MKSKVTRHKILVFMCFAVLLTACDQIAAEVDAEIEFLSKEEGQVAILDETYEPYFSQLQKREISAFVQEEVPYMDIDSARMFAREKFSSAVSDFTASEKACITFAIAEVTQKFRDEGNSLFVHHPWKLIKIEDWLCGGFAHTRGDYIILSQKHIDHLSSDWSENMTPKNEEDLVVKLGGLLVHEQMHSLQRNYKADFASFYEEKWKYVDAVVKPNMDIVLNQVSNPDAPVANWLIPGEDESYYWIRTLLKPTEGIPKMGADFTNVVYVVKQNENNSYTLAENKNGDLETVEMSDLESFTSSFPKVAMRGIDHPNEISAYMMSSYFQAIYSGDEAFSDEEESAKARIELFKNWVQDYMHNHTK